MLARYHFPALSEATFVLMTTIPQLSDLGIVEISNDIWVFLRFTVPMVTLVLYHGTSWRRDDAAVINRRISSERLALEKI